MRCTLFCDESGNSGGNLVDPNQPVYVLGGWLVPEDVVSDLEETVSEFKSSACPDASEVHGVRVLRTEKGRRHFSNFLRRMANLAVLPIYHVVEKRYWIAGKVVETYLDPFYNPKSDWSFFNDVEAKQRLANQISLMPLESLRDFGRAYRKLDLVDLQRSAQTFAELLRLGPYPRWGTAILGAVSVLPDIISGEQAANHSQPNNAMQSINLPTLLTFLSDSEQIARQLGASEIRVAHDRSQEFEAGYRWWFDAHSRLDPEIEIPLPNDHFLLTAFTRLSTFEMLDSVLTPGIQAADLLVTAIQMFAKAVASGSVPENWLLESMDPIMRLLLHPPFDGAPHAGRFLGSPEFSMGLVKHLPSFKAMVAAASIAQDS